VVTLVLYIHLCIDNFDTFTDLLNMRDCGETQCEVYLRLTSLHSNQREDQKYERSRQQCLKILWEEYNGSGKA
jgi:hypothetical protein